MITQNKSGNSYRAFIAVEPPKEIKAKLRDYMRLFEKQKRNLNLVPPDQLLITLQFLGEHVPEEDLARIAESLAGKVSGIAQTDIIFSDLRFGYKAQRSPTTIFLEIEQTPELKELTRIIHNHNKLLDIYEITAYKDHAKLIYHLNLAKTKRNQGNSLQKELNTIIDRIEYKPIIFPIESIGLYTSDFSRNDTTYRKIADWKLQTPQKKKAGE